MTTTIVQLPACPECGSDFDEHCGLSTGQAWDPTQGVRSSDADRHKWSGAYGPSDGERAALRRRAGAR